MPIVHISDSTKELLNIHMPHIKEDYITQKLFLDSAVKQKLRSMGIKTPPDDVIAHLKRLEKSKQTHRDRQRVHHAIKRHEKRMTYAKDKLKEL